MRISNSLEPQESAGPKQYKLKSKIDLSTTLGLKPLTLERKPSETQVAIKVQVRPQEPLLQGPVPDMPKHEAEFFGYNTNHNYIKQRSPLQSQTYTD